MSAPATTTEPFVLRARRSRSSQPNRRASVNTRIPSGGRASGRVEVDHTPRVADELETACVSADVAFRILGVGRTAGYKSINDGTFPVAIVRIGRIIRVPLVPLRRALGIADDVSENNRLS